MYSFSPPCATVPLARQGYRIGIHRLGTPATPTLVHIPERRAGLSFHYRAYDVQTKASASSEQQPAGQDGDEGPEIQPPAARPTASRSSTPLPAPVPPVPHATEDDDVPEESFADKLKSSSKDVLPTMYPFLSSLLILAAMYAGVFPAQWVDFVAGMRHVPTELSALAQQFAATLFFPLAALFVLKDAVDHDRLGSDTYRRLNLGLLGWALGVSVAVVSAPGAIKHQMSIMLRVFASAAAASGFIGYQAGAGANFSPVPVIAGLYAGIESTFAPKTLIAGAYSIATAAAGVAGFAALVLREADGASLSTDGGGALGLLLGRLTGVGLLFAAICIFTLKDAADRGRLGASTFKLLNLTTLVASMYQLGILGRGLASGLYASPGLALWSHAGFLVFLAGVSGYQYSYAKK